MNDLVKHVQECEDCKKQILCKEFAKVLHKLTKECYSCHLNGDDGIKATKTMYFGSPNKEIKGFPIDLCDDCFEWRMKND